MPSPEVMLLNNQLGKSTKTDFNPPNTIPPKPDSPSNTIPPKPDSPSHKAEIPAPTYPGISIKNPSIEFNSPTTLS